MGYHTPTVAQCPGVRKRVCGAWYTVHVSGLCKVCRPTPAPKARKARKTITRDAPRDEDNWRDNLGYSGDY